MSILLGKKLGMTRVFDQAGNNIPVTAIEAGPCVVVQCKSEAKDGYNAVQIGIGASKHPNKPEVGHAKGLAATPEQLREFRLDNISEYEVGKVLDCSLFKINDTLKLVATSKGKGFSGVIKKHGFHRGPSSHGSDHHRAPGSIGSMYPQHVLKGKKMPGRAGNEQVSLRKVRIVDIISDQNIILVKGPVPGSNGNLVEIARM